MYETDKMLSPEFYSIMRTLKTLEQKGLNFKYLQDIAQNGKLASEILDHLKKQETTHQTLLNLIAAEMGIKNFFSPMDWRTLYQNSRDAEYIGYKIIDEREIIKLLEKQCPFIKNARIAKTHFLVSPVPFSFGILEMPKIIKDFCIFEDGLNLCTLLNQPELSEWKLFYIGLAHFEDDDQITNLSYSKTDLFNLLLFLATYHIKYDQFPSDFDNYSFVECVGFNQPPNAPLVTRRLAGPASVKIELKKNKIHIGFGKSSNKISLVKVLK